MHAKDKRLPYRQIVERCRHALRGHRLFRMDRFDLRSYVEDESRYELFVIKPRREWRNRPHVFVIAGFHGEEPAGPMAVARGIDAWLAYASKHELNLTIVPCANPWGYDRNIRNTPASSYTNGGFLHGGEELSKELKPLKRLLAKSRIHYYIDLHEDDTDPKGAYTYCFGDTKVARAVLAAMTESEITLDPKPVTDDPLVRPHIIGHGLVHEAHDGSSEDMVSHKRECLSALAPELPSKLFPLSIRAAAHDRGVRTLLEIAIRELTKNRP